MDSVSEPERRIGATDTTFEIVEYLSKEDSARLSDIADSVGLSEGTIHTYLATMKHHGFVMQENSEYRLGFRFLEVGGVRRQRMDSIHIIRHILDELIRRSDEIAWFIVEEDGYGVFIEKALGREAVQPCSHIGKRRYLHCIAGGKAILSELPRERVERIIDYRGLPPKTDHTITEKSELYEELESIKQRGYAFNRGENIDGWRAVASPIVFEDSVYGSIAISGPSHRIEKERFETDLPEQVSAASNEVQLELRSSSVTSDND